MIFFELIVDNEQFIRLGFFLGILVIMAIWEIIKPKRLLTVSKLLRWSNNLGLVLLNSFLLRLIFPTATLGMATFASEHRWGLFNYYEIAIFPAMIISIIVMDFVIYLQHVMVHTVPALWRIHRVHHADPDYDVTTGARFHPLEIILSMMIKFSIILVLGPPLVAVILFEVILNGLAMFNHGNVGLPRTVERPLRYLIITPDMHRVHHSIEDDEANTNFGFNLSCWDRLFGTYRDQPRRGHTMMTIGIHQFRSIQQTSLITGMLAMPFKGRSSGHIINNAHSNEVKK